MTIKRPRKPPARKPTPLNAQMERFCQEYLKAPDNQTDAPLLPGTLPAVPASEPLY